MTIPIEIHSKQFHNTCPGIEIGCHGNGKMAAFSVYTTVCNFNVVTHVRCNFTPSYI